MPLLDAALLLILSTATPLLPAEDSLRSSVREARRAAWRYERVIVTMSSERFGGGYGDRCDEIIGRFCFWHSRPGTPRPPIEPEAPELGVARDHAIHAFRRWFSLAPADGDAAGPLLRYLIESERASEAVAAARAHVWAAEASHESLMLLGLALHYAKDFPAAEAAFDSARAVASDRERRRLDDLSVLLDGSEASTYRRLDDEERRAYEARFWALADPWLMDPGNERRSAHYARHTWARILEQAPRVQGKLSWGRDHEELLIRYGRTTGRQRIRRSHATAPLYNSVSLVEWFDPRRVALTPDRLLTRGISYTPDPDVRPEIQRDTVRSHYAPLGIRRTQGLMVQPTVFPVRDGAVVRVDALLPPDSVAPRVPHAPDALLVLLDTLGTEIARTPIRPRVQADSTVLLSAQQKVEPGAYVYRVEVRDDSTGLAGLAQYRIDVAAADGLTVSDLLVAEALADPPRTRTDSILEARLIPRPGQEVGLYAEVSGLRVAGRAASFDVQWWIEKAEEPGLLRRAARWLGERVGLVDVEPPTRVGWEEGSPDEAEALFLNFSLSDVEPGVHRLGLLVRDRLTGEEQTATRLIRIDPNPYPLRHAGHN